MGLRISDEFTSPGAPAPSVDQVANDAFRSFISTTLDELGRKGLLAQEASDSHLKFVRVALAASGDSVPQTPGDEPLHAAGSCTLDSPWANVALSADGNILGGTIYWNERQILRDRAMLEGVQPPAGPATALPASEFAAFARLYGDNLMSGEALPPGAIPSDLLWLFLQAPQSTRGPFAEGAEGEMRRIAADSSDFHAELVAALLERCRQEPGKSFEYKTIKEVGSINELEGARPS